MKEDHAVICFGEECNERYLLGHEKPGALKRERRVLKALQTPALESQATPLFASAAARRIWVEVERDAHAGEALEGKREHDAVSVGAAVVARETAEGHGPAREVAMDAVALVLQGGVVELVDVIHGEAPVFADLRVDA